MPRHQEVDDDVYRRTAVRGGNLPYELETPELLSLLIAVSLLYYKVLQELGYSRNMKVAALERKLKKDARYDEFTALFKAETGEAWEDYQNDELVVDSLLPSLAHKMYPAFFKNDQAFSASTSETIYLMDDRVREMIEVVRSETGKQNIVFVIDEIGQYVGSQQSKILDLQGLAENIKNIGQGKVWIFGTAQQTLTEDDPHTAINSPELFKLKDRFPIVQFPDDELIGGLKVLLSSQFDIGTTIQELKRRIVEEGRARRKPPEPKPGEKPEQRPRRALRIPPRITTADEFDRLIKVLQELRSDAPYYEFDIEIGEE